VQEDKDGELSLASSPAEVLMLAHEDNTAGGTGLISAEGRFLFNAPAKSCFDDATGFEQAGE